MRLCPTCGHSNADIFRFCLKCGVELTKGATAAKSSSAVRAAPVRGEPVTETPSPEEDEQLPCKADSAIAPGLVSDSLSIEHCSERDTNDQVDIRQPDGEAAKSALQKEPSDDSTAPSFVSIPEPRPFASEGSATTTRFCMVCGALLTPEDRFCPQCGSVVQEKSDQKPAAMYAEAPAELPAANVIAAEPEPTLEPEPEASSEPEPQRATALPPSSLKVPREEVVREVVGYLVAIRPDGSDGETYALMSGETTLGLKGCDLSFPEDEYLDGQHARFLFFDGRLSVDDCGAEHGVFVRISDAVEIINGSQFRVGQQLLHVNLADGGDRWGDVRQLVSFSGRLLVFPLRGDNMFIGRERGHIVFPDDGYVSGSHAVLYRQDDQVMLKDLNSSNGTYIRITKSWPLVNGSFVLTGQHLFRVRL